MDYEVQRFTRCCAKSGRAIEPGEVFYSTLKAQGAAVVRQDYAAESWSGPPEGVFGWWKAQVPTPNAKKIHWAPNDVMLELLDELAGQTESHDMRYVLSLLLIRRRVVRLEDTEHDPSGREVSVLYCPRREATYRVVTMIPSDQRTCEIQEILAQLLFAKAA